MLCIEPGEDERREPDDVVVGVGAIAVGLIPDRQDDGHVVVDVIAQVGRFVTGQAADVVGTRVYADRGAATVAVWRRSDLSLQEALARPAAARDRHPKPERGAAREGALADRPELEPSELPGRVQGPRGEVAASGGEAGRVVSSRRITERHPTDFGGFDPDRQHPATARYRSGGGRRCPGGPGIDANDAQEEWAPRGRRIDHDTCRTTRNGPRHARQGIASVVDVLPADEGRVVGGEDRRDGTIDVGVSSGTGRLARVV